MTVQRMTTTVRIVLSAFLENPDAELYGLQIQDDTALSKGTVYPILHRMVEAGWLASRTEGSDYNSPRPPRKYYRLTEQGLAVARAARPASSPGAV
jgi:PadR family transcriptional regulator PadR